MGVWLMFSAASTGNGWTNNGNQFTWLWQALRTPAPDFGLTPIDNHTSRIRFLHARCQVQRQHHIANGESEGKSPVRSSPISQYSVRSRLKP